MFKLLSFAKKRGFRVKPYKPFKTILPVLMLTLVSVQANSALLKDSGRVTHRSEGVFEFSVDAPSSRVNIWERSRRDFRITLFDGLGNYFATNDDHGWGRNAGGHHRGQNWLDASLTLNLLEDNYTAVVSYWTNHSTSQIDDFGRNFLGGNYRLFVRGRGVSGGHNSVPEPGTLVLLLLGSSGLAFRKFAFNRKGSIAA